MTPNPLTPPPPLKAFLIEPLKKEKHEGKLVFFGNTLHPSIIFLLDGIREIIALLQPLLSTQQMVFLQITILEKSRLLKKETGNMKFPKLRYTIISYGWCFFNAKFLQETPTLLACADSSTNTMKSRLLTLFCTFWHFFLPFLVAFFFFNFVTFLTL